jgi:hypothetical protein
MLPVADILEAIAEYPLDVPFALIYLREPDDQTLRLCGSVRVDANEEIAPTTVCDRNLSRPMAFHQGHGR